MADLLIFAFISLLSFSSAFSLEEKSEPLKTYIVHVRLPADLTNSLLEEIEIYYHSFLPKTATGANDVSRMVRSYRHVFTGFAAKLSPEEVQELEKKEGFLYARPQKIFSIHTTHTPTLLGLHPDHGVWPQSNFGKGVIIGLLDNGIKADHPSFNDEGMPDRPHKWKGKCHLNGTTCNNKLIGARNFCNATLVDANSHGTHTSSTAAGNFIENANVFGNANGTACGIAPLSHLAMYQVCPSFFCLEDFIAAGFEAAIPDGVDVLSISLGAPGFEVIPFYEDVIAIGAFRAMVEGIFVSCSAGNSGPTEATLSNEAPWILTVGAGSVDRNIRATVLLGNNETFDGETLFQPRDFHPTLLPLVFPGKNGDPEAAACVKLKGIDVKGKIVLCESYGYYAIGQGESVREAGAAAMIRMNQETDGYTIEAEVHVLPASEVSFAAGQKIKSYINSTESPMATILFKGTIYGEKDAPAVAAFSSRGPNKASPGILKPDILGPGLNILGAWPYSVEGIEGKNATFHIVFGTSMSAPHLSGVAALIKELQPGWSPAAIKSAIITTAEFLNLNGSLILDQRLITADIFATGAGLVNPSKAADPGLIYDIQPQDYIGYLCGLNYTDKQVEIIANQQVKCSRIGSIPEGQLNYPSFAVRLGSFSQDYIRTVTNVGEPNSIYEVKIEPIPGVDVYVHPDTLMFTDAVQKLSYNVTFARSDASLNTTYVQGAITWISGEYKVRSPISIKLI